MGVIANRNIIESYLKEIICVTLKFNLSAKTKGLSTSKGKRAQSKPCGRVEGMQLLEFTGVKLSKESKGSISSVQRG